MHPIFLATLRRLEAFHGIFAASVPAPRRVPFRESFVFRYLEKTPQQAIVQKLARNVSGLHAARLLCEQGLFQEQIIMHRILDEIQEDIAFLSDGVFKGKLDELHQRYLNAFYEEEFDNPNDPLESTQKRTSIPRQKIRAYLANAEGSSSNPSRHIELLRTIHRTYSGYVHAASPQVMHMYGGDPPRFHVAGQLASPYVVEHTRDLCNYLLRGIIAFGCAAAALELHDVFLQADTLRTEFMKDAGMRRKTT